MNQHTPLPSSNVREIGIAPLKSAEQFIIVRGTRKSREPYLDDTLMSRAEVIVAASDDVDYLRQIIAFSIETGTCRDATDEITSIIIDRWADDCKELSRKERDFVAMCKGEAFANAFRVEAE
jgi:hypothetical protein